MIRQNLNIVHQAIRQMSTFRRSSHHFAGRSGRIPIYVGGDPEIQQLFDKYQQIHELPLLFQELNELKRYDLVCDLYELPAAQGNIECLRQYLHSLTCLGRVTAPTSSNSNANQSNNAMPFDELQRNITTQLTMRLVPGWTEWIWRGILVIFALLFIYAMFRSTPMFKMENTWKESVGQDTTFDDVKGIDETVNQVQILVDFLKHPEAYKEIGAKMPHGVLFVGPPGTGKTLLARAVAGEAGVPFLFATGSDFDEIFVGVGPKRMRALFQEARQKAPCIVFIDEIDSIGKSRGSGLTYNTETLNKLLAEIDGFEANSGVILIGATNHVDVLDPALVRPGRFDYQIVFDIPDIAGRTDILKLYLAKCKTDESVDPHAWAGSTYGWTGASIANFVNQAAIRAVSAGDKVISDKHLHSAFDDVSIGLEKTRVVSNEEKYATAVHESGHALVNYFSERGLPIRKITVVPRGNALGFVDQIPVDDFSHVTKADLLTKIAVCMAGRAAEEIVFGPNEVSTGASNDIEQATKLATRMVEQFGMSDEIGPVAITRGQNQAPNAKIEAEIARICKEGYNQAKELLLKYKKEHKILADSLMVKETILGTEIEGIIGVKGKLRPLPEQK